MKTNNQTRNRLSYPVLKLSGLLLIVLTLSLYIWPDFLKLPPGDEFFTVSFLATYACAVCYFVAITIVHIIKNGWNIFRIDGGLFRLFVILFSISSFSLNRTMHVIAEPTEWLQAVLGIVLISVVLYSCKEVLPGWMTDILWIGMGLGGALSVYAAIILAPIAVFGIMFGWFAGIPLLALIPYLWLAIFIVPLIRLRIKSNIVSFAAGFIIPFAVAGWVLVQWSELQDKINESANLTSEDLPTWVILSQELPDDAFTAWALKSGIILENGSLFLSFDPFISNNFGEKKHDPLLAVASAILGKLDIEHNTQLKIIETKLNYRHEAIPAYWSGSDLTTEEIETNIEIFPEHRLAYTEKTIQVRNNCTNEWWGQQQEALYTFHLPEGTAVTSLSLWIDGIEQKARLTTQEKADSAYSTIVGRERRDPSVVKWHEGNRVVVRVFPVLKDENRTFRIGFTSPLQKDDNELLLKSIYFQGPDQTKAKERITIYTKGVTIPKDIFMPDDFSWINSEEVGYSGNTAGNWTIRIADPGLSNESFVFNGYRYTTVPRIVEKTTFTPTEVYFDINNSWSYSDFELLCNTFSNASLYVESNGLQQITESNRESLFHKLHSKCFSMFPVFRIKNPSNALVITSANADSPCLEDLQGTRFHSQTFEFLSGTDKFHLADIGDQKSLYWKGLEELNCFNSIKGKAENLTSDLLVPHSIKTNHIVSVQSADMSIVQDTLPGSEKAPDHLLRLFTYNKIMDNVGRNYFNNDYVNSNLLDLAREGYVVSPVSGLIVLESQADYDRFDIGEANDSNSLMNAGLENSGAVPEPHEWALIIIALLSVAFIVWKKKFNLLIGKR